MGNIIFIIPVPKFFLWCLYITIFESTVNPPFPSNDFDKTSIPRWYDVITVREIQNNAVFAIFGNNQMSPVTIIAIKDLLFIHPNNATAIEIVRIDDHIVDCLILYRHRDCARENIVLFAQYHTDAVSAVFPLTLIYFLFYLHPSSFHMRLDKQYFTTLVMIIIEPRTHTVKDTVYIHISVCVCIHRYIAQYCTPIYFHHLNFLLDSKKLFPAVRWCSSHSLPVGHHPHIIWKYIFLWKAS